jgi:hypothetical protein
MRWWCGILCHADSGPAFEPNVEMSRKLLKWQGLDVKKTKGENKKKAT